MSDWLSIGSLGWSLLRVIVVWLAFYGTGSLILRVTLIRKYFRFMPSVIAGMLVYTSLAIILSLLHLITRDILTLTLIIGAIIGSATACVQLKRYIPEITLSLKYSLILLPTLLALFIILTNLMIAGRPDLYQDDALVTYMVQPDRWLIEGQIIFLEETGFSGLPLTAEILFLFPASLSENNRLDQLILSQIFVMSLLFASVLFGCKILKLGWKWFPVSIVSISGCYQLVLWGHMAKPDIVALFFVTVSIALLIKYSTCKTLYTEYSAFLIMGLAVTSKQTAYLALIPFCAILLSMVSRKKVTVFYLFTGFSILAIIPVMYAIRTAVYTGSPFYPHFQIEQLLKPEWAKPELDATFYQHIDRSSDIYPQYSFLENIWHYFREWGSSLILLLGGFLLTIRKKHIAERSAILLGIAAYSIVSLFLFYPAWWGAKYGILMIPLSTLFGIYLLRKARHVVIPATAAVILLFFIYESNLSPTDNYGIEYRCRLLNSYLGREWICEKYPALELDSYLPAIMWMNNNLPEGSRVLSLFDRKRYFSDHEFYVLQRHPAIAGLLLDNSLEDEIELLRSMKIDYILSGYKAPMIDNGENMLEILKYRSLRDGVLQPIMCLDDYVIYRFMLQ